jgi:hypothetical protein
VHWRGGAAGSETPRMTTPQRSGSPIAPLSVFAGLRFPSDVIVVAVRWYLRFGLSYPDVEELLGERGVQVDHATITSLMQRSSLARWCVHA